MNDVRRSVCIAMVAPALVVACLASARLARAQDASSAPRLSEAQLEQLVAPIALYPDSLLAQVLMASTYPLEVVEAARWVKANPKLGGQALEEALQKQSWDPSVKSLTGLALRHRRRQGRDADTPDRRERAGDDPDVPRLRDAQREYYDRNPQGGASSQYARRVASSKGKRDGLYWNSNDHEPPSPLGELFASARGEGYTPGQGKPSPYHGYVYRILKAQGPHAPGGAYDYVVRGKMIGGFALVAYPAEYGSSGVMTFVVNHDGVVYEKDLGPDTAKLAQAMKTFDPDDTWTKAGDGTE